MLRSPLQLIYVCAVLSVACVQASEERDAGVLDLGHYTPGIEAEFGGDMDTGGYEPSIPMACVFGDGIACFDGEDWAVLLEPGSGAPINAMIAFKKEQPGAEIEIECPETLPPCEGYAGQLAFEADYFDEGINFVDVEWEIVVLADQPAAGGSQPMLMLPQQFWPWGPMGSPPDYWLQVGVDKLPATPVSIVGLATVQLWCGAGDGGWDDCYGTPIFGDYYAVALLCAPSGCELYGAPLVDGEIGDLKPIPGGEVPLLEDVRGIEAVVAPDSHRGIVAVGETGRIVRIGETGATELDVGTTNDFNTVFTTHSRAEFVAAGDSGVLVLANEDDLVSCGVGGESIVGVSSVYYENGSGVVGVTNTGSTVEVYGGFHADKSCVSPGVVDGQVVGAFIGHDVNCTWFAVLTRDALRYFMRDWWCIGGE